MLTGFSQMSGTAEIAFEEVSSGGSSGANSVSTTAPLTLANGQLYLATISTKPYVAVGSVAGLGLNWQEVRQQCGGRTQTGLALFWAQGTPTGDGIVTADLVETPSSAVIAVSRYSGVQATNPIGNSLSGNTNGLAGDCTGGSDSNAYTFDLTTTANNALVFSAVAIRNKSHTPGNGFTERFEVTQGSGGNMAGQAGQDRLVSLAGAVAVEGSISRDVDWAVVAVEVKPGSDAGPSQYNLTTNTTGNGSVTLDPPGGVYDAGTVVTLTATPAAGWQFDGWSGNLSGTTNPATLTMDGDKSVSASFSLQPSTGGQVTFEEIESGSSERATNVSTTGSLTAVNGDLYLAAVSTKSRVAVVGVSGLGLSWYPNAVGAIRPASTYGLPKGRRPGTGS